MVIRTRPHAVVERTMVLRDSKVPTNVHCSLARRDVHCTSNSILVRFFANKVNETMVVASHRATKTAYNGKQTNGASGSPIGSRGCGVEYEGESR